MALILPTRQDHLLLALAKCEELRNSNNAPEHQSGSLAALTPANLQMELDTMLELQAVLHTLARKLDINSTCEQPSLDKPDSPTHLAHKDKTAQPFLTGHLAWIDLSSVKKISMRLLQQSIRTFRVRRARAA